MEIPGYCYDPVKNKYFSIQHNHIAPPNSAYSVDAIKERNDKSQAEQIEQQRRFQESTQRLKHDRRVHHPLTSIQYRLTGAGHPASYVAEHYGASLRLCPAQALGVEVSSQFVLNGSCTDTLIVARKYGAITRTHGGINSIVALQRKPTGMGICGWTTGGRGHIVDTVGRIGSMLLTTQGLLAWTEEGASPSSCLHVASLSDTYQARSHVEYACGNEHQAMGLAASPHGQYWLGWTSSTIFLRDGIWDAGVIRLQSRKHIKKDDLLEVAFKDEWTVMAGHRSGYVNFIDHREGSEAQVCRLRHNSPLNKLRILKDDHTLLANGPTSTALYDLRYTAIPWMSKNHKSISKSAVTFSIGNRTSDRIGLGLDYCPELNLVVIANSQGGFQHNVTLYSSKTGKQVASRLGSTLFAGPTPCLKFARSYERPQSLLMAPECEATTLLEWACDR